MTKLIDESLSSLMVTALSILAKTDRLAVDVRRRRYVLDRHALYIVSSHYPEYDGIVVEGSYRAIALGSWPSPSEPTIPPSLKLPPLQSMYVTDWVRVTVPVERVTQLAERLERDLWISREWVDAYARDGMIIGYVAVERNAADVGGYLVGWIADLYHNEPHDYARDGLVYVNRINTIIIYDSDDGTQEYPLPVCWQYGCVWRGLRYVPDTQNWQQPPVKITTYWCAALWDGKPVLVASPLGAGMLIGEAGEAVELHGGELLIDMEYFAVNPPVAIGRDR